MAEVDSLEVKVEASAKKANAQLDSLIAKLNKVQSSLNGMKMPNVGSSSTKVSKLGNSLRSLVGHSNRANKSTKSLARTFGKFYANCFLLIRGVKALGRSIGSTMDYIETFNYYNVTMDKIAKEYKNQYKKWGYNSADEYAKSFSSRMNDLTKKMSGYNVADNGTLSFVGGKNLNLDPNQLMNYEASISAITNSVGLCGETSVNTSKALTMLSADMSSLKNIDMKTVMTNFQSGLIGQSRALYKYGIDITNTTLQTYAYKYGLSQAVSEMTQASKMQLRLLAILDQSKVAWGDMANTINSVANQWRIFKQQVQNVARTLGALFIPVLQAVLPMLNGLMIALGRGMAAIGTMLYGADHWKQMMDGISKGYTAPDTGLEDTADEAGDVSKNLNSATDNAKKLQRQLQKFDELNVINTNEDTSGAGTGSGGGTGSDIDLSKQIASALKDYESVWRKALNNSENLAQQYADRLIAALKKGWKNGDFSFLGKELARKFNAATKNIDWTKIKENVGKFGKSIATFLNGAIAELDWEQLGRNIAEYFNTSLEFFYKLITTFDFLKFGTQLSIGLNSAIKNFDWSKLGITLGASLRGVIQFAFGTIKDFNFKQFGTKIGDSINGFFASMGRLDKRTGLTGWQELGQSISNGIKGIATTISTALSTVDWGSVGASIGQFLASIDWVGVLRSVGKAIVTALWSCIELWVGSYNTSPFTTLFVSSLVAGITVKKWLPFATKIASVFKSNSFTSTVAGGLTKSGEKGGQKLIGSLGESVLQESKGSKAKSFFSATGGQIGAAIALAVVACDIWGDVFEQYKKAGYTSQEVASGLAAMGKDWGSKILNAFSEYTSGGKIGQKFVKGLTDGVSTELESKDYAQMVTAIKSSLGNMISESEWNTYYTTLKTKGQGAATQYLQGILSKLGVDNQDIQNMLANKFNVKDLEGRGITAGQLFVKGVKKGAANVGIDTKKLFPSTSAVETRGSQLYNALKKQFKEIEIPFKISDGELQIKKGTTVIDVLKISSSPGSEKYKSLFPKHANGAMGINNGQVFVANEAGPEMVGKIGNKSAVVNQTQIISSVSRGVASANSEQTAILVEQNRILRAILNKEFGITSNDIYQSVKNSDNSFRKQTGHSAFVQ